MLNLTHRLSTSVPAHLTLALTAEDRSRSRHYFEAESGQGVYLRLPRGTVLRHGDLLQSEDGTTVVQVIAKPEPVMVVTAQTPLQLLRAAYHLGNRHVPLEVTADYLQCLPDSVLKAMLEHLGVQVSEALLPFNPEAGAYSHPDHDHDSEHSHSSEHSHHSKHSR